MNRNNSCFTLIEVLLALFITAILITILSVVFNTGLRSYRQGRDLLEITRKAQLILGQMTRELSGAIVQKDYIKFEGNDNEYNNSIFFISPMADEQKKLDLCEIGYLLQNDELKRHLAQYGDDKFEYPNSKVDYETGDKKNFCEDIINLDFRYYNKKTGWQGTWDSKDDNDKNLPQMVEVSVKIQGEYGNPPQNRVFTTWIYLPNSTNNP